MRKVTIPVDDNEDVCNTGYLVEYRIDGVEEWTQLFPNPLSSPIIIENLEDDTLYNIRVMRQCCNGTVSAWTEFNVDTTL